MTRDEFQKYWEENYKPISYEDVKEAYEAFQTFLNEMLTKAYFYRGL